MPATTYLTPNGTYVQNVMPYPTDIVQDVNVPDGKAIFGLASRYFMGVGKGGAGGKVEYSDEVRFWMTSGFTSLKCTAMECRSTETPLSWQTFLD